MYANLNTYLIKKKKKPTPKHQININSNFLIESQTKFFAKDSTTREKERDFLQKCTNYVIEAKQKKKKARTRC